MISRIEQKNETVMVPETKVVRKLVLELNEDEAGMLSAVVGKVAHPSERREMLDILKLYYVLIGFVDEKDGNHYVYTNLFDGRITQIPDKNP
jgi:hypothetical protein